MSSLKARSTLAQQNALRKTRTGVVHEFYLNISLQILLLLVSPT